MSQADLVRIERGEERRFYRCKNCSTVFEYGRGWYNAFYCGSGCAAEYNRCDTCGDNRNWCECRERCSRCGCVLNYANNYYCNCEKNHESW